MKKTNTIIIISLAVALAIVSGIAVTSFHEHDEIKSQYVPSDLNNVYSNYEVVNNEDASWATTDIKDVKHKIDYTIKGTIVSISDPIPWLNPPVVSEEFKNSRGQDIRIVVDILVEKAKTPNKSGLPELAPGSIYTVTITGKLLDNVIMLDADEEQYEINEKVIVHVAADPNDVIGEDVNYVLLAKHSKYKIQDDKAYNEKFSDGRTISSVMNES